MEYQTEYAADQFPVERHRWVDLVRVVGTFLVVLAHVQGWGAGPKWAASFYYTLSRNGVPLFFMISGFLLLSRREDMLTFFKKRAWKVLIPFVAWTLIYDVYWNQELAEGGLSLQSGIRLFLRMMRGPRAEHLWFFYVLIGLYLFTPVLRPLIWKASDRELLYYIGLWILAVPGLTIIQEFTPFRSGFELQLATGYVGYYLLGHVLGGIEFSSRRLLLFSLLLLAGFIVTFLVFYMDIPPQDNEAVFRSYLSANIIFMAVSSLVFLRLAGQVIPPRMVPLLDMFSQASFGIYLMHSIVMRWLDQGWEALGMDTGAGSSLLVIPAVAAVGFLASFFITMVLRKIPVLKTIVP